jgi:hypothetical protein
MVIGISASQNIIGVTASFDHTFARYKSATFVIEKIISAQNFAAFTVIRDNSL